jgi:glycosyltransferase involved in cell wall biosynthesis
VLVDAFCRLKEDRPAANVRLHVGGYFGAMQADFVDAQEAKLRAAGLADAYRRFDCPTHADKQRFLAGLDVLSVPTVYRECKGLYVLEALASGVPVVQPRHGSFPELVEATGGGLLVEPENPTDLARTLGGLIDDRNRVEDLGRRGREAIVDRFHDGAMATATMNVLRRFA